MATQAACPLRVVYVADLEKRLASSSELALLTELAAGDSLLTTVLSSDVRCALVSYKQEQSAGNALTLDGPALRGVIAAARTLQVDALWMDAWCYRSENGSYDHQDFTRTLRDVIGGIKAVVWLPRSKQSGSSDYAYRLWCTFEVACVKQRGLPVALAGQMSAIQQVMLRLGSFTPALSGAGPAEQLCRINLAFYGAELGQIFLYIIRLSQFGFQPASDFAFAVFVSCINPLIWLGARSVLGQQVRLTKNAFRVLRTMASGIQMTIQTTLEDMFLKDMPWLPCCAEHVDRTRDFTSLPCLPCHY